MNTDKRRPNQSSLSLSVFICVYLWLITLSSSDAFAHTARMTSATATVSPAGDVKLSITFDTIAYALNDTSDHIGDDAMTALLDGPPTDLDAELKESSGRLLH